MNVPQTIDDEFGQPVQIPMHARMAIALGWSSIQRAFTQNISQIVEGGDFPSPQPLVTWYGVRPWRTPAHDPAHDDHRRDVCPYAEDGDQCGCDHVRRVEKIPLYTSDWSITGPMIERHGIELRWTAGNHGLKGVPHWIATRDEHRHSEDTEAGWGMSVLEAVSNLIVALAEKDKL